MGDARLLSVTDALACHRLVGELLELWDRPVLWQRHLADGVERIVGGFGAGFVLSQPSAGDWKLLDATLSSTSDVAMREMFLGCVSKGNHTRMPGARRLASLGGSRQHLSVRFSAMPGGLSRFYRSEFYNEYLRPFSTGDTVTSFSTLDSGAVTHLTVLRDRKAKPFDARATAVLAFISEALAPHVGNRLVGTSLHPLANLSPRLRQTLELLLRGESEKRVASALSLSTATVHEYIGTLYRRLNVHSRSELLALYVQHALPSASVRSPAEPS